MIPARFFPYAFAFFLSGMMSFLVSGLATYRALGAVEGFGALWLSSWAFAWAVAFPAAVLVAPLARRLAGLVCAAPENPENL